MYGHEPQNGLSGAKKIDRDWGFIDCRRPRRRLLIRSRCQPFRHVCGHGERQRRLADLGIPPTQVTPRVFPPQEPLRHTCVSFQMGRSRPTRLDCWPSSTTISTKSCVRLSTASGRITNTSATRGFIEAASGQLEIAQRSAIRDFRQAIARLPNDRFLPESLRDIELCGENGGSSAETDSRGRSFFNISARRALQFLNLTAPSIDERPDFIGGDWWHSACTNPTM